MTRAPKVCVVTGVTRGIGRAIASELTRHGHIVVGVGRTDQVRPSGQLGGSLQDVRDELAALGAEGLMLQADLARPAERQQVIDRALGAYGQCDVLINNAAQVPGGPFLEVTPQRWQKVLEINCIAPVHLMQGFLPSMLARGQGTIINISSQAAIRDFPWQIAYGASKSALERLTRGVHKEFADSAVSVSCLRIDEPVGSELWQTARDDAIARGDARTLAAIGGDSDTPPYSSADVARAITWVLNKPDLVRGNCFGFEDLRTWGALPAATASSTGPDRER
jgi:NAD(P)-dependent dehydrogenase (short-subunit alcohol dehydrogenase family)